MIHAETIKIEAARLGFSPIGITDAAAPEHFAFYTDWLEQGYHGEMGYLDTERSRLRRSDPRQILPECETILVLGLPYPPASAPEKTDGQSRGRIASYAWGRDYHDVILGKLEALAAFIEREAGEPVPHRIYVDTGPILERDLAQRAGLGWIGKNTCLIHPKTGSYFFLSEILLGCKLEPDSPFISDHCGSCTRCIEACPTTCILPDRTLDASRCISYLTIELKGPIPTQLRPQMEDWVFGCDICQQVCPWNIRFARQDADPALDADPEFGQPALADELALDAETFKTKFSGSPVRRAKRSGYLRNVAVALGNTGSEEHVPVLLDALIGSDLPLVRGHAAWALGRIGGNHAADALERAAGTESDPYVREEIVGASRRLAR